MRTITVDTNILVSALIAKGKPRKLIKKVEMRNVGLVLSNPLINEFHEVIKRSKFRKYVAIKDAEGFANEIKRIGKTTDIKSNFRIVKEDPEDDIILDTAYDGKADYIVSGDPHLLNLKEFQGVKIVTVDEMLKILESEK